ncbi:MAG: SUKH-4 family immunity protein, partial [Oscillospiraceae bacterium]|nr:SUKH-4 family immunity protein [Oscillospiraceae bacterium]
EFFKTCEYFDMILKNRKYQIIGKDNGLSTVLIGIAEDGKLFWLETDEEIAIYIACSLEIFKKELYWFSIFEEKYPENPSECILIKRANAFRERLLCLDSNAFSDDENYWAEVAEEMEYGVI